MTWLQLRQNFGIESQSESRPEVALMHPAIADRTGTPLQGFMDLYVISKGVALG
jgi:hypothetical protein